MVSAQYDREAFAIAVRRPGAREPIWIYLSNVYAECAGASRSERRERIDRLIRIMAEPHVDEAWESVRPKLRPVLRPVTFGQAGVTGVVPPISRAALPLLRELVVIDQPESMAYVGPSRLDAWGVTVDEVFDAARANLTQISDEWLRHDWPGDDALIRMIDTGDGYFTSLLLAPDWLAEVSRRAGKPVVAFVPDTNTVLLCDVAGGGLAALYEMVEKEYGEAIRGLSPVGYVAGPDGRVVPYAPVDHADRVAARRAEVLLAATEYGAQTQWLAKQYDQAGIDVYVGRLLAVARPGEPAVTVATWTDGITSLLPEAQYISFVGDGGPGPRVPWRVVAELVGLEPEPLLAPARYRVSAWPPPEVMAELRARAID
ncbi:hypothetical protein Raf01_21760 [Rugosimonospora africana]|uniref:Uncharacterized protein n=1 Tax=Rugosimonospora africana TaxID=556532 RepID=A0A8J3VPC8_9ACTN|nr:hypothetical protein Raf01_21760 [Rugosimonospora africana]